MLIPLGDRAPNVHESAWVAPSADLVGSVELRADSSVWYTAVLRAEFEPIVLGERSNLQDGVVVHTDVGKPTTVGAGVSVLEGIKARWPQAEVSYSRGGDMQRAYPLPWEASDGKPAPALMPAAEQQAISDTQRLLQSTIESRTRGLQRIGIELALRKASGRPGDAAATNTVPGANIEAQFQDYAALIEGQPAAIDLLVDGFNEVYKNKFLAARNPSQA